MLIHALLLQIESLEKVCVDYRIAKAKMMTPEALLCLAKLGEHIDLHVLLDTAADCLIKLPWQANMKLLGDLIRLLHGIDKQKAIKLLHRPSRGAYSELQVLELLAQIDLDENDVAAGCNVDCMQAAEFNTLIAILVNKDHANKGAILRKAVQKQVSCNGANSYVPKEHIRSVDNITLADHTSSKRDKTLSGTNLCLRPTWSGMSGK